MTSYAIQAGALRTNPNSGPDGVGVQADIAYTLEARAEVQAVLPSPAAAAPTTRGEIMLHDNDNSPGPPLRFLSVCSGIEAASVAWPEWTPVAFSEIEKFPSAVLAHHYPDVPNLGDFTKIDTTTLGRVDILCGGTPCQAFSVAGLRKGLDDERGNLTLKFVELAHELAGLGKTDGNGLRNVVWENVVGVLSDKGNAFGCFLAGLVGADSPIDPPARGKWPGAGMVSGPKGRAAWRIVDAQYFGVAQRRRRVLVVADFGNGADPAQVLFELEGVQRHTPPSREAGKGFAGAAKGGAGVGSHWDGDYPHPTLSQSLRSSGGIGASNQEVFSQRGAGLVATYAPEIARCDATREGSSQDYETTTMVAVTPIDMRQASRGATMTNNRKEGSSGGAPGTGIGEVGDPSPTISTSHPPAICVTGQISHALTAEGHDASEDGSGRGAPIVCVHADAIGRTGEAKTPSLDAAGVSRIRDPGMGVIDDGTSYNLMASGQPHAVAHAFDARQSDVIQYGDMTGPLDTDGHTIGVLTSAVRRLTPVECERLQGFPDNYTAIPWRGKPADQCPDGPRYKALGNSWAVPKFAWLGKRLQAHMPQAAITNPPTTTEETRLANAA